ncbi:hypothetical protein D0T53_10410 [Dysgonomonas sp. 216]|nr:hypothetical protein [Dysgonomonas sp. 216]
MKPILLRVTESIAKDIQLLVESLLDDDSFESNALKKGLCVSVDDEPNPVVRVIFNSYIEYLENGRKPKAGEMPSVSELKDWAESKGISADNATLFLVARVIWMNGFSARPILALIEEEVGRLFENDWSDQLFDVIVHEIDKIFK